MATLLHLLTGDHASLAAGVMVREIAAGHDVVAVLLGDAEAPPLPPGLRLHRAPDPLSYDALLDLVLAADHVITW